MRKICILSTLPAIEGKSSGAKAGVLTLWIAYLKSDDTLSKRVFPLKTYLSLAEAKKILKTKEFRGYSAFYYDIPSVLDNDDNGLTPLQITKCTKCKTLSIIFGNGMCEACFWRSR
jgi:hypothetical protein